MKKKTIIIHSSEIVRKGLAGILRNYFNAEIVQFQSPENTDAIEGIISSTVIVFIESHFCNDLVHPIVQNKKAHCVLIYNNEVPDLPPGYLYSVSLKYSAGEIFDAVKKCYETGDPSPTDPEDEGLTIREKEVLKQVALGFSNKEIAEKLNISIHTVISHRKNLTEKLSIKSISGLTVYAIINKLIDTSTINPKDLI